MAEAPEANHPTGSSPSPSLVSVIVPVYNGSDHLDRCLAAILQSDWPTLECIVVDDGSTDPGVADCALRHGVRYHRLENRSGPAAARNAGVEIASGQVLFFTDADVLLRPDTLSQAMVVLQSDPAVAAVIGSYDDQPTDGSLVSRYRNLFHHYNHQIAHEQASTFWTGCGAIRKPVLEALGGFNSRYGRPSIEDIEFGYRLVEAGEKIRLHKDMRCTHMKHWSFTDMVLTDIFQRGVPWVALLLQHPSVPRDLNLNWRAKLATLSAALLGLILLGFLPGVLAWGQPSPVLLPACLALLLLMVWTQWGFYRLLARKGGFGFALAAVPLQFVFFLGCAASVPLGWLLALRQSRTMAG
jgi:GT2 family glycosyltransferase